MIDLEEWVDANARRPLVLAIAAVLGLQVGYLAYLAHDEYAAQLLRIDRVVETASLGMQQSNRPLIESVLITGLHNADAASVALCDGSRASILYPPTSADPCRPERQESLRWTVRRRAVGLSGYEFVFVINWVQAFAPFAAWLGITLALSIAMMRILLRARTRFLAEVLTPLQQGLHEEKPLPILELDELRKLNQAYNAMSRRQAVSEALFQFSAQVAHDIRSPLAVLEVVARDGADAGERRDLLTGAIARLRDIADSVLKRYKTTPSGSEVLRDESSAANDEEPATVQELAPLIRRLLDEKRVEFRAKAEIRADIGEDSRGLSARVQPVEFSRALSNLINNAVEALEGRPGTVSVGLFDENGAAAVRVRDDGKGIPAEVLATLGRLGASHGKKDGNGRGLHHARARAESWGGALEIESAVGRGSTVTLRVPRADGAESFDAVLIDDDALTRTTWRIAAGRAGKRLREFDSFESFVRESARIDRRSPLYLDASLGDGIDGVAASRRARSMGFDEVYLETGHPAESFADRAHLRAVVGKEPPW